MQDKLIFLISAPRSGSTLLMRILNATSSVYSRPEPHLIPALAHLGYWDTVEKAPFDQFQARQAMIDFVSELPEGEEGYYEACRAYCDSIYAKMLEFSDNDEQFFLDKTPANALVLPFLEKVYPKAKYIFLTRHPAAIFASYSNSFFDGDYEAAAQFNPILSRYIPAMADSLRRSEVSQIHISYEELASNPEQCLERLSGFLNIPFEADALDYKRSSVAKGLGDPIGVEEHNRPVKTSINKWAPELLVHQDKFEVVAKQLASISSEDLRLWGVDPDAIWLALEQTDKSQYKARRKKWNKYRITRRLLLWIRKDINSRPLGKILKRIRRICDVLLRG